MYPLKENECLMDITFVVNGKEFRETQILKFQVEDNKISLIKKMNEILSDRLISNYTNNK